MTRHAEKDEAWQDDRDDEQRMYEVGGATNTTRHDECMCENTAKRDEVPTEIFVQMEAGIAVHNGNVVFVDAAEQHEGRSHQKKLKEFLEACGHLAGY